MKKILILFFLIIFLGIGYESVISVSSTNEEIQDEAVGQYLQEVFEERVEIWNRFMMDEDRSLERIEAQLKKHTTKPQLTLDMEAYEDMIKNPTSYEMIRDVRVKKCQLIEGNAKEKIYLVEILWLVEGYHEVYYEEVEYILNMKNINNQWFLSKYQISR